ncbi:MAG: UDP-N-acetyl glucosamine 2-epimerase [Gemmatimonadales bacterium]
MPPQFALCYGTRPQIIKASAVREHLARIGGVLAVDTGQHYDFELNGLLYQQLGVKPPDRFLEVGSGSHAEQTSAVLIRTEALLREHAPAAVVVIGDTNSTLGSALAAAKLRIPLAHVEAGLRARDAYLAEEINRRMVDAVAGLLCAPGPSAAARLHRERSDATIVDTGDVARDVLVRCLDQLPDPARLLPSPAPGGYLFATLHRAEITSNPALLEAVLEALGGLPLDAFLALHPRTRAALDAAGRYRERIGRLTLMPPVGYLESLALTRGASAVVTDSGGLQREAYWLGVPCITVRDETEWVETVDLGANRLVAPAAAGDLAAAVQSQLDCWRAGASWDRDAYGRGEAAGEVARAATAWLARST